MNHTGLQSQEGAKGVSGDRAQGTVTQQGTARGSSSGKRYGCCDGSRPVHSRSEWAADIEGFLVG